MLGSHGRLCAEDSDDTGREISLETRELHKSLLLRVPSEGLTYDLYRSDASSKRALLCTLSR